MWKSSGQNPVLMLGRLPQATLERSAADSRFLALYRRADLLVVHGDEQAELEKEFAATRTRLGEIDDAERHRRQTHGRAWLSNRTGTNADVRDRD